MFKKYLKRTYTKPHLIAVVFLGFMTLITSCASVETQPQLNQALPTLAPTTTRESTVTTKADDLLLMMSFSGGGARASALAYGVLEALRDTPSNHANVSLVNQVDYITAVSGGSFTAAYFALFGDRLFTHFKPEFLHNDVNSALKRSLLHIQQLRQLSSKQYGVSDALAEWYDAHLFQHKTLQDLFQNSGPVVDINAVDISRGTRFSFSKKQLQYICTDPASIPVARAVAASSAVPAIFSPIAIENHAKHCNLETPEWVNQSLVNPQQDARRYAESQRILSYLKPGKRRYIHLLDGGLVDNLGVRASIARSLSAGGLEPALEQRGLGHTQTVVFIVVDAANWPSPEMDEALDQPKLEDIVSAATSAPLVEYNKETLTLLRNQFRTWQTKRDGRKAYVIHLNFDQLEPLDRDAMQGMPTSLSLPKSQADAVIRIGQQLLKQHPEFKRWIGPPDA